MLSGLANVSRHLRGSFAIESLAVAEQLFTATNLRRYPAERYGAEFKVYAVTVFEIDGDKLRRTADYYDVASILSQLSAAHAPQLA
ncbi:MAG: hypothetical protein IT336_11975 [Thermomicrobiales bacterium]|nr:hypothetical protein [Thermomicrobiales bacterium]